MRFDIYVTFSNDPREHGPFVLDVSMIGKTSSEIGAAVANLLISRPFLLLHTEAEISASKRSALVSRGDGAPVSTGTFGGRIINREHVSAFRVAQRTDSDDIADAEDDTQHTN